MTEIVAVGEHWYLSRKAKFAVETQVSYRVIRDRNEGLYVYARNDVDGFTETVQVAIQVPA